MEELELEVLPEDPQSSEALATVEPIRTGEAQLREADLVSDGPLGDTDPLIPDDVPSQDLFETPGTDLSTSADDEDGR